MNTLPHHSSARRLLTPAAFAVLLALSPEAWSAAGKIVFATGDVRITRHGVLLNAVVRGTPVEAGDLLSTGNAGFAQLQMDDGGRVTLRANSQLRLDAFDYDGKPNRNNRSLMSLLTGSMRAITGLIGHNNRENYRIATPTATVGIRGSDGNIGYDPAIGASVQTLEGGHTLSSVDASGRVLTLELNPGETGLVPPGGVPVRVDMFPFATTQAPQQRQQVASTSTRSSGSAASTTAGSSSDSTDSTSTDSSAAATTAGTDSSTTLPASTATTTASAPAEPVPVATTPPLNTDSGGITVVTTDGTPVDVTPGGTVVQPPPQLGTSTLASGVISSSVFRWATIGSAGQAEVRSGESVPSDLQFNAAGNLTGYVNSNGGEFGGGSSISGASQLTISSTGDVKMGGWSGVAGGNTTLTDTITQNNSGRTHSWAFGTAGFYDIDPQSPSALPLTGTMTYTGTQVGGRTFDGQAVTLTSTTLSADFNAQLVQLTLGLDAGGQSWSATASSMPLQTANGQSYLSSFSANTGDGSLVVTAGGNAASGSIGGSFTGANFSGALVQYQLNQDTRVGSTGVTGGVAYKANGTVNAPAVTQPAVNSTQLVVSDLEGAGNAPQAAIVDSSNLSGWTSNFGNSARQLQMQFSGGTVTSRMLASGDTVVDWTDGTIAQNWNTTLYDSNTAWLWGTINRPQAWYLGTVLSGTSTYTPNGAITPRSSDGSTWTLDSAQTRLVVDFTNQLVDAQIGLQDTQGSVYVARTTDATLSPGDGHFEASTWASGGGSGTLTVTRDGTLLTNAQANGQVEGQLGGSGWASALVGWGLQFNFCLDTAGCTPTGVGGMISLNGPSQDENQSYTTSNVALQTSSGAGSTLGFGSTSELVSDAGGIRRFVIWPNFEQKATLDRATAVIQEQGSDSTTGMSWGRWSGTANVLDTSGQVVDTATNVHFVTVTNTGPAQLPVSGTFNYTAVGNTLPTNQNGATGTLDNATLTADFTNRMVDVSITASVAGTTLTGTGTGVKLFDAAFQASSSGGGTGGLGVQCSGTCGTINGGTITGNFTANGGLGAGVTYTLESGAISTINGAVVFKRP